MTHITDNHAPENSGFTKDTPYIRIWLKSDEEAQTIQPFLKSKSKFFKIFKKQKNGIKMDLLRLNEDGTFDLGEERDIGNKNKKTIVEEAVKITATIPLGMRHRPTKKQLEKIYRRLVGPQDLECYWKTETLTNSKKR
jgi:hypothetical protein